MQPAAAPVAATAVAAGGGELATMRLAAYEDSAADMILGVPFVTTVPLLSSLGVDIAVTYPQMDVQADVTAITVTVD